MYEYDSDRDAHHFILVKVNYCGDTVDPASQRHRASQQHRAIITSICGSREDYYNNTEC
jgi:hypothetical protein